VYHGAENRPNLVVTNAPDGYRAHCFKCHESDWVPKEHVKFSIIPPTVAHYSGGPGPLVDIAQGPVKDIVDHLHNKNMSLIYIAHLQPKWSLTYKRLMFDTEDCLIGRAVVDGTPDKWHIYEKRKGYFRARPKAKLEGANVVLTEDIYSACKVMYAVKDVEPVALLGTTLSDALLEKLMLAKHVHLVLDGDSAGLAGTLAIRKTLNLLGVPHTVHVLLDGYDPKDYPIAQLRALFGEGDDYA
jgi:hypothetical protein